MPSYIFRTLLVSRGFTRLTLSSSSVREMLIASSSSSGSASASEMAIASSSSSQGLF